MFNQLDSGNIYEFFLWILRRRRRFRVTGRSMLPLLQPGDEILANPRAYRSRLPNVGEIVVMQHPIRADLQLVKRVIAVSATGDCFLQGDNPNESTDSRAFGVVKVRQIMGQVTSRFE